MELQYGATVIGVIKISTSEYKVGTLGPDAKINIAYFSYISSSTDSGSGLLRMTKAGDKITKSMANDRVKFTLDGEITDGYSALSILVMAKTVSATGEKVLFPIDDRTDIVVNSGTFTQNYQFKMMPGATLTVKSGATYNMNGTVVAYKNGFTDLSNVPYPTNRGDAKIYVEGIMNINGSFGGDIYGVNGGKVVIGQNATITSVKSTEGTGKVERGDGWESLSIVITFTESNSQYRNLTLNNASGTTTAAVGTTYTYNGTAWA